MTTAKSRTTTIHVRESQILRGKIITTTVTITKISTTSTAQKETNVRHPHLASVA